MKTVSVIMCTYNGARYLKEQIDSILQQTYPIYELIIQDDCSTDETVHIVREYMERYPIIKLYENAHNLGFNQNFKSAAMKASGDFVGISDQDDIWFPEKIERQVSAIGHHDICCSQYVKGPSPDKAYFQERKFCFECQLFCSVCGHTMLCQRQFIQNEAYWLPTIWYDWSLTLHAYLNNGIAVVDERLNYHRLHEQGSSYLKDNRNYSVLTPYWRGYSAYHKLQKDPNWQLVYSYLLHHTETQFPLIHRICGLMLKSDNLSLMKLCYICYKYREQIYPNVHTGGLMGRVRGFFFPFFHGYFSANQYRDCSKS